MSLFSHSSVLVCAAMLATGCGLRDTWATPDAGSSTSWTSPTDVATDASADSSYAGESAYAAFDGKSHVSTTYAVADDVWVDDVMQGDGATGATDCTDDGASCADNGMPYSFDGTSYSDDGTAYGDDGTSTRADGGSYADDATAYGDCGENWEASPGAAGHPAAGPRPTPDELCAMVEEDSGCFDGLGLPEDAGYLVLHHETWNTRLGGFRGEFWQDDTSGRFHGRWGEQTGSRDVFFSGGWQGSEGRFGRMMGHSGHGHQGDFDFDGVWAEPQSGLVGNLVGYCHPDEGEIGVCVGVYRPNGNIDE